MVDVFAVLLALLATCFSATGSFFLKRGADNIGKSSFVSNYRIFAGLGMHGVSAFVFISALKLGDLSVLYPITSLTYVWVSFLSLKYLDESMNRFKWSGILLIMLGVVLVFR